MNPKIFLDREGNWFSDGEEITHPRTVQLFSRSLRKCPDGKYELSIGKENCPVEIEDTPYQVRQVDFGSDGVTVTLNDESEEPLALESLEVGKNEVLYCRVKQKAHAARFLRKAYYQLAQRIDYNDRCGFHLRISGKEFPIKEKFKVQNPNAK
jgi:hypothetical protein